jgi:hypothetical protein
MSFGKIILKKTWDLQNFFPSGPGHQLGFLGRPEKFLVQLFLGTKNLGGSSKNFSKVRPDFFSKCHKPLSLSRVMGQEAFVETILFFHE